VFYLEESRDQEVDTESHGVTPRQLGSVWKLKTTCVLHRLLSRHPSLARLGSRRPPKESVRRGIWNYSSIQDF